MKKYVVVGGGVASVGCIEGIRSIDKEGEIALVFKEGVLPYCRPLISYFLEGKTDFEKMNCRPKDYYEKNGCRVLFGQARNLNAKEKTIEVDKETLQYDALCVATGSTPFVPPFVGLDTVPVKTSFLTENDAAFLDKNLTEDSRVLIVGAGLIGLKCAEGIARRVKSVVVCDLADRVLSSILDAECAERMQKVLEVSGVTFYLKNSVRNFDGNKAVLQDGTEIVFDILVTAVGVRAETSLVKDIIKTDKGILVDRRQATSDPYIYSAGDCAQGYDASIDGNRVLAIFPNAYMQGYVAGVNMAGGNALFDKGMPLNAIGFFGLHALTAGRYDGEMTEIKTEKSIKRLFVKDDRLVGFMLIGEFERAGILTSLIREKTPLSEIDWQIMKNFPVLAAFGKEKRKTILGGVV